MSSDVKTSKTRRAGKKYPTDRDSLERDSDVDFFSGSGPGGQHRNRSRNCVRLRHRPSGTIVTATDQRSQSQNLETAFRRLRNRLVALNRVPKRRKPTRPSRASKEKRLRNKAHRGRTKQLRKKPDRGDY